MNLEQGMMYIAPWMGSRLFFIDGFTRKGNTIVRSYDRTNDKWGKPKTITNDRFFDTVKFVDRKTAREFMKHGVTALEGTK